ncbi:Uncharacterized protein PECH_008520 [Penicillium ucsense]|uniref:Regulator of volume decrease after cellular swelling-domain-containing protein n=1 Tax=Penicillium ucsense TaxID=2839758 RepID=A0A8J8WGS2_9EURO|nr:Uncharacterized protein PECM_006565 [Penicillium ucsense]KAF7734057.1 Uncharacterized protein PECH_008520 [Penicillium ucsense]
MEALQSAPEASSFVTIAEHQSRTPTSFHHGPTVLYYHGQGCKLVILEHEMVSNSVLNALRPEAASANGAANAAPEDDESEGREIAIEDIDVWVTSEKFILYSRSASTGISIPYPSISLHAIQRLRVPGASDAEVQGLYMQITLPTPTNPEDDEEPSLTMTIVPPAGLTPEQREAQVQGDEPTETPTQILYNAVSACSNLHPDPVEPGDEDDDDDETKPTFFQIGQETADFSNGSLPPPVDGSSGWITADNMHEFFDEEGNWIGEGEPPSFPRLGPGAGTVRSREDGDDHDEGANAEGGEDDETKWRRTD